MLAGAENQLLDWSSPVLFVQKCDAACSLQRDPGFVVDDEGWSRGCFPVPFNPYATLLAAGYDDATVEALGRAINLELDNTGKLAAYGVVAQDDGVIRHGAGRQCGGGHLTAGFWFTSRFVGAARKGEDSDAYPQGLLPPNTHDWL